MKFKWFLTYDAVVLEVELYKPEYVICPDYGMKGDENKTEQKKMKLFDNITHWKMKN